MTTCIGMTEETTCVADQTTDTTNDTTVKMAQEADEYAEKAKKTDIDDQTRKMIQRSANIMIVFAITMLHFVFLAFIIPVRASLALMAIAASGFSLALAYTFRINYGIDVVDKRVFNYMEKQFKIVTKDKNGSERCEWYHEMSTFVVRPEKS